MNRSSTVGRPCSAHNKKGAPERALTSVSISVAAWRYAPALLEKLDTACASVSNTSNTVSSLVICSTSWNLLPRWQSRNDAPCDFALWWAATSVPKPALSMNVMLSMFSTIFFLPSEIRLFTFSRSALLSSPRTMRPSSATTATPSTSRYVIFSATFSSSYSLGLVVFGLFFTRERIRRQPGRTAELSNSPHRTCNTHTRCKSACNVSIPTAASRPDNTAKDLHSWPALCGQRPPGTQSGRHSTSDSLPQSSDRAE